MEIKKQRISYLEAVRLLAIILVIYTHSVEMGIHIYRVTDSTITYWVSLLLLPLSQISVPLFFMVSGALLLQKKESLLEVFRKRTLRMLLVTAIIVLLQYIFMLVKTKSSFSFTQLLNSLYGGGIITQQWFLYAYISMLLILPMLQRLAQALEEKSFFYYLFVLCLCKDAILPMWEAVSDFSPNTFSMPLLTNIIIYPLWGYFIECRLEKISGEKKKAVALVVGSLLILVMNALMNNHSYRVGDKIAYLDYFTVLYTVSCFVFIKYIFEKKDQITPKVAALWSFVGSGVFGTYLFEQQLRDLYTPVYYALRDKICLYPALIVWIILVVATGITATNILKKLPVLNQLL